MCVTLCPRKYQRTVRNATLVSKLNEGKILTALPAVVHGLHTKMWQTQLWGLTIPWQMWTIVHMSREGFL